MAFENAAASGHFGKTPSLRQHPPLADNLPCLSIERYLTPVVVEIEYRRRGLI
jgi:hypothetical protein